MINETRSKTIAFRVTPSEYKRLIEDAQNNKMELSSFLYKLTRNYLNRNDLEDNEKPRLFEFSQLISDKIISAIIEKIDAYEIKNVTQKEKLNTNLRKLSIIIDQLSDKR
jgi:hypothetical protein